MKKPILTPSGKIIRENSFNLDDDILVEGLMICLDKMTRMRQLEDIQDYLFNGSDDKVDIKEEVARLLLIATTLPSSESPIIDISQKLMEDHVIDINSMYVQEFLDAKLRCNKSSFMNSDFYQKIGKYVEKMDLKASYDDEFCLNDGIVLVKNIRNLYIANIDQNIDLDRLDLRYRESLIDLFQYNLDCTLNKIKNGVRKNVQVQTRHQ